MIPIPIDLKAIGSFAGWGIVAAGIAFAIGWIYRLTKKAERGETERSKNEILGKQNKELEKAIVEGQKREAKFDEVESQILNDPDSIDTSELLNSSNYLDAPKPPGPIR